MGKEKKTITKKKNDVEGKKEKIESTKIDKKVKSVTKATVNEKKKPTDKKAVEKKVVAEEELELSHEDKSKKNNKEKSKKSKKDAKDKKVKKEKKESFLKGVVNEMSKVTWPTKRDMIKYSIATIIFIIFFAIYFYCIALLMAWLKANLIWI